MYSLLCWETACVIHSKLAHNKGVTHYLCIYSLQEPMGSQIQVGCINVWFSLSKVLQMFYGKDVKRKTPCQLRMWTLTMHGYFNSLWPSDAIWRRRSGSTLAQVMACCLTAPIHYLNLCWLIICEVQWHSYQGSSTRDALTITKIGLKIICLKFYSNFPGANELSSDIPHSPVHPVTRFQADIWWVSKMALIS